MGTSLTPGRILGYGGLLPFFALAALAVWGDSLFPAATTALVGWGAVILSFVGAVHWGFALDAPSARTAGAPAAAITASVLPATVAWLALLLPARPGGLVLIGGFVGFYLYERVTNGTSRLPRWYLSLRTHLTAGACVALAIGIGFGQTA